MSGRKRPRRACSFKGSIGPKVREWGSDHGATPRLSAAHPMDTESKGPEGRSPAFLRALMGLLHGDHSMVSGMSAAIVPLPYECRSPSLWGRGLVCSSTGWVLSIPQDQTPSTWLTYAATGSLVGNWGTALGRFVGRCNSHQIASTCSGLSVRGTIRPNMSISTPI